MLGTYAFLATFSYTVSTQEVSNCKSVRRSATLLKCLVCVICNSKSFHSFSFKLCIMIVQILKMCTSYFVHISWIFSQFWRVLNLDIFLSKMLRGCLVCVICNSNSFHFFIFKLCIMIVHTLKMGTYYFCTFDKYFLTFDRCWT